MDLETENRIAALLLKEAAELCRQAQRECALAYLRQPTIRCRPNSRFLTATVRGVQQANRAVEVNEMWRLRKKQFDLDSRLIRARNESNTSRNYKNIFESSRSSRSSSCNEHESSRSASLSSKNRDIWDLDALEDEGLRDDEVDKFLNSRSKRGRGAVGSRMDEAGPYLPSCPYFNLSESVLEKKNKKDFLGPKKPYHLKCDKSPDDESGEDRRKEKGGSSKGQYKKQKTKDKLRDEEEKKNRKKKRHKYH